MTAIGKIIVGLGLIGAFVAFDSTCGRQACIEACTRQAGAEPNGDPVGAAISRFLDNLPLSIYQSVSGNEIYIPFKAYNPARGEK
ncbi:MAG: hypothetical protein KJ955_01605 [Nanoarchaeota archaeon]|nr:hypothetical protein [Nanoarchaeota archaeon]